jgi:hypothetical protein
MIAVVLDSDDRVVDEVDVDGEPIFLEGHCEPIRHVTYSGAIFSRKTSVQVNFTTISFFGNDKATILSLSVTMALSLVNYFYLDIPVSEERRSSGVL